MTMVIIDGVGLCILPLSVIPHQIDASLPAFLPHSDAELKLKSLLTMTVPLWLITDLTLPFFLNPTLTSSTNLLDSLVMMTAPP